MDFGTYLEECIKKKGIPVGTVATQIGLNRGNLYSVFSGKRKLSEDHLHRIVSLLALSNPETQRLYNKFFELEYGKAEFERARCVFDLLKKMPDYYEAKKPEVGAVSDLKNLSGESDIVSAANYIIENSVGEISTNYSYESEKLDELFFYFVKQEGFRFRHLVTLPFGTKGTQDIKNLFSSVRFMYEKCYPYLMEVPTFRSNSLIFPYFIVSEKYVMVFDADSGTVIESESFARTVLNKINEMFFGKAERTGDVPVSILDLKDVYSKSFLKNDSIRYELGPYPCVAPYGDKQFFFDIAVDSMPPDVKNELVNICYDHYQRMTKNSDIVHILSYDAVDLLVERRVVDELPADYCKLINEEQLLNFLQLILKEIQNDKIHILDDRCFRFSKNLFIEINSSFITLNGTDIRDENFMVPQNFYAVITDQSLNAAFRNFFDYLLRSKKTLPKDVAVGYLENRIARVTAMIENKKKPS